MTGDTAADIQRCLNCKHPKCINCLIDGGSGRNPAKRKPKAVIAVGEDGRGIRFADAREAAEHIHSTADYVRKAASKNHYALGYTWRYEN